VAIPRRRAVATIHARSQSSECGEDDCTPRLQNAQTSRTAIALARSALAVSRRSSVSIVAVASRATSRNCSTRKLAPWLISASPPSPAFVTSRSLGADAATEVRSAAALTPPSIAFSVSAIVASKIPCFAMPSAACGSTGLLNTQNVGVLWGHIGWQFLERLAARVDNRAEILVQPHDEPDTRREIPHDRGQPIHRVQYFFRKSLKSQQPCVRKSRRFYAGHYWWRSRASGSGPVTRPSFVALLTCTRRLARAAPDCRRLHRPDCQILCRRACGRAYSKSPLFSLPPENRPRCAD
jgi:hypothetical protein